MNFWARLFTVGRLAGIWGVDRGEVVVVEAVFVLLLIRGWCREWMIGHPKIRGSSSWAFLLPVRLFPFEWRWRSEGSQAYLGRAGLVDRCA